MTDETVATEAESVELDNYKLEAEAMGISFHPSIGLDKLKEKINLAKAKQEELTPKIEVAKKAISQAEINKQAKDRALALVRIRVNCMDPSKSQFEGDYFSAGNSVIGNITKYVHFNEPWCVPYIIYQTIKQAQYQAIVVTGKLHGNDIMGGKQQRAYAIEELGPPTPAEIKEIAQRQATANSVN